MSGNDVLLFLDFTLVLRPRTRIASSHREGGRENSRSYQYQGRACCMSTPGVLIGCSSVREALLCWFFGPSRRYTCLLVQDDQSLIMPLDWCTVPIGPYHKMLQEGRLLQQDSLWHSFGQSCTYTSSLARKSLSMLPFPDLHP